MSLRGGELGKAEGEIGRETGRPSVEWDAVLPRIVRYGSQWCSSEWGEVAN